MDSELQERMDKLAERFEGELRQFVDAAPSSSIPNLHDAMIHALGLDVEDPAQRGKRIRPILCLLTAETLGAPIERAIPFAVAIELMHNFCLVHDDIEDGDTMRRGRPSLWMEYGLPHAINTGDYMLVQTQRALLDWHLDDEAYRIDDGVRLRLLRIMTETLDRTHIGQALDMNARTSRELDRKGYFRMVHEKTGYYLAAPFQGGAIIAGADPKIVETFRLLTYHLGVLFQIMDDIIDLTEGKGRDDWGSDIREGKRSFMVVWVTEKDEKGRERIDAGSREKLFDILDKPREETTAADVLCVRELFEACGAIEAGRKVCQHYYDLAKPILKELPEGLATVLDPILKSLISRKK